VSNTLTIAIVAFVNAMIYTGWAGWRKAQLQKGEAGKVRVKRVGSWAASLYGFFIIGMIIVGVAFTDW
jgi:hypothetical protein